MNKFISIRTKLISNFMLLISVTLILLLAIITISNIVMVNKSIQSSKKHIRNSLIAKGKILAKNNSLAMKGMAEDNAFTAIQALVSSTVNDDQDLLYGIYMDSQRMPWVNASSDNQDGIPNYNESLDDSISIWASKLTQLSFIEYSKNNSSMIEFAAPVSSENEILGYIRYGYSTVSMEKLISEAQAKGRASRISVIIIVFALGLFSFIIGYIVLRHVAARITHPIGLLVTSSKVIAEGNYDVAITSESNDEIGDLSMHFEAMRVTIKKYTDHLQDLIDEKMQQVNDILNNIDQGLFTINLDGTVNQEYSARANSILEVDNVASLKLKDLLRLNARQEQSFSLWLDLVKKKHASQRWKKLVKLAPVHTIELPSSTDQKSVKYISISYQRIYNKTGTLSKIMFLAYDETENRLKDIQMSTERKKHENDVKIILAIAKTPSDEMADFTSDTSARLAMLRSELKKHLDGVLHQRRNHPHGPPYLISNEDIDRIYRDIHTIKGNCGSYGFDTIASNAHQVEDILEKLRVPVDERRDNHLKEISDLFDNISLSLDEIHQKIQLIYGRDEEISLRIPETRISNIVKLSKSIPSTSDFNIQNLISECIMLSWRPLKTLLRKYDKMAFKIARRLNKNIIFTITDETKLFPHDSFSDLDEVIIHLIRNAIDHGIEDTTTRDELGKGVGKITLFFSFSDNMKTFSISDDGHGIDTEQIIQRCIAKKMLSRSEADRLKPEEVYSILYKGGLSTRTSVSDISGRGMGMQIIYNKITMQLGGTLEIQSTLGKGTTFTISIPT
jgi:signal transduction histidine kinase/HAMP domain-containing protein